MNLTELCAHLRNYFVKSKNDIHTGTFEVNGGYIDLPWLADGQYFRIIGSVFNDGVWQYPTSELTDETFDGAVWAMSIPPDFIKTAEDIEAWKVKYDDAVSSPYQSESFGGYSYTKASNNSSNDSTIGLSWQSVFRSRLNQWRKL